jgi:hypothetical protein
MVNEVLNGSAWADKIKEANELLGEYTHPGQTSFLTSVGGFFGDPYWKAGKVVEVARSKAPRLLVSMRYRIATVDEKQAFLKDRADRTAVIQKEERAKKQTSVLEFSDEQFSVLMGAQAEKKARKGDTAKGE